MPCCESCKRFSGNRLRIEGFLPHCRGQQNKQFLLARSIMYNNNNHFREGSEAQYDPRTAGEILNNFYPNTELGINLKLITREPGRMPEGKCLEGTITRDSEDHYTFLETLPPKVYQRNPRVFDGKYITVTRKKDGRLQPNFKPIKEWKGFSPANYAKGVANELLWAMESLLEKEVSE